MTSLPSRAYRSQTMVSIRVFLECSRKLRLDCIVEVGRSAFDARCPLTTQKSYLGEQGGPDGLDFDTGSLDQSLQLVGLWAQSY